MGAPPRRSGIGAVGVLGILTVVLFILGCAGCFGYAYYDSEIKPQKRAERLGAVLDAAGSPDGFVRIERYADSGYATGSWEMRCTPNRCTVDVVKEVHAWLADLGMSSMSVQEFGEYCWPPGGQGGFRSCTLAWVDGSGYEFMVIGNSVLVSSSEIVAKTTIRIDPPSD